jgi:glycosyltransferase involved in cell wall biosynthesis
MPQTLVLLSAYNGSRYIEEQIDSIRRQSFADWALIVRDDGSTDSTRDIVTRLAASDSRISLLDDRRNVGPWQSFGILMEQARALAADRFFLCDQDDVWLPDKMAMELARLASIETARGIDHPCLVHTDLKVVDETLHTIDRSWHRFQRMSYNARDPLRTLLIHNAVAGCTILGNRALLDSALPFPHGVYHDWWLAACAAAFGTIEMVDTPTVLYRQHSTNVVGAEHRHSFIQRMMFNPMDFVRSSFDEFSIGVSQAAALRDRAKELNTSSNRIARYCDAFLSGASVSKRIRALRDSRARPQRLVSRILMYGIVAAYPTMRAGTGSSATGGTVS